MNKTTTEAVVLTEEQLQNATVLVANLNPDREVAVVDMNVLEYLVRNLPVANIHVIKKEFAQILMSDASIETIEDYTELLANELAFHSSINMVKAHFLPQSASVIRNEKGESVAYDGAPSKKPVDAVYDERGVASFPRPQVVAEVNGD